MACDLSKLDLLMIQIDGLHIGDELVLVAAVGIDGEGDKHPLGLVEGATENAATVQALIDNLVERGLDPAVPRLFIIDGAKALSKAIRRTFGRAHADPALPGSQGPQRDRAAAQVAACLGPPGAAASLGAFSDNSRDNGPNWRLWRRTPRCNLSFEEKVLAQTYWPTGRHPRPPPDAPCCPVRSLVATNSPEP